jgi:hypothetical protein
MTPQERELVTELFDRLATLENAPRDPDAERTIIDGLRRAPNAVYALVQTALVQDEALKRANARIQELESQFGDAPPAQPAGFLDGMRDALLGRREGPRGGSVPSVRPGAMAMGAPAGAGTPAPGAPAPGAPWQQPGPVAGGGGSFLGTAASAAAGVIGGSLLLDGIRSMMGHGHSGFGMTDPAFGAGRDTASPWSDSGGGDLARQAGIGDIGTAGHGDRGGSSGAGLFGDRGGDAQTDEPTDPEAEDFDDSGDFAGDFGGGGNDDA